jgi:methylenetetrahydrofolate reductase (NADPH)
MATRIGVGESTRYLAKNKRLFSRIAAPGGFTGERFVLDCAQSVGGPTALVEGLHVFTFNQVAETEMWRTDLIDRLCGQGQP